MKRYHVPLGRRDDYPHPAPERTAVKPGKGIFDDDVYQVWPSRGAMLQACRMSDRGICGPAGWRPLVKTESGQSTLPAILAALLVAGLLFAGVELGAARVAAALFAVGY